jgi:hypothetical protein
MEDETPSASNPAPTGRLAAVTRKQHQIEKLLHDVPSNLAILKKLFTEYLTCVETLYNLTPPGLEDWLNTHKPNIEQFRTEISKKLYPAPISTPETRKSKSIASKSSSTSSSRIRIAEQKAKLVAQREMSLANRQLQEEELKLKADQEEEVLNIKIEQERKELKLNTKQSLQKHQLNQRKQQLEQEGAEREIAILEQEIGEDGNTSVKSKSSSSDSIHRAPIIKTATGTH